jgi:DNA-binding Xre family transcriptional regulator
VKWNLRLAAAQRGIWKASDLQRTLADHGLVISAGKMSGLWSGQPASIKLDDLDIICAAIGCAVTDLLIAEPEKVTKPVAGQGKVAVGGVSLAAAVVPQRRDGRSLPPA